MRNPNWTTAAATVACSLAAMLLASPDANADETWRHGENVYATEVGDDNGDGVIDEDESGWDCNTNGNLICGGAK